MVADKASADDSKTLTASCKAVFGSLEGKLVVRFGVHCPNTGGEQRHDPLPTRLLDVYLCRSGLKTYVGMHLRSITMRRMHLHMHPTY